MLVRFSNAGGCSTCTNTIDTSKWRALGMFKALEDDDNSYYVRLSLDNGDTYTAKKNMNLSDAINYRNLLENYWYSSATGFAES